MRHILQRIVRPGLLLLAAALLLPACSASKDKSTYKSTVDRPTTVTLRDPLADRDLWRIDIPVGQKLTLDFDHPHDVDYIKVSSQPAQKFSWKLERIHNDRNLDKGRVDLTGHPVQVKVSYRPSPEYPLDYSPRQALRERGGKRSYLIADEDTTVEKPQTIQDRVDIKVPEETPIDQIPLQPGEVDAPDSSAPAPMNEDSMPAQDSN